MRTHDQEVGLHFFGYFGDFFSGRTHLGDFFGSHLGFLQNLAGGLKGFFAFVLVIVIECLAAHESARTGGQGSLHI